MKMKKKKKRRREAGGMVLGKTKRTLSETVSFGFNGKRLAVGSLFAEENDSEGCNNRNVGGDDYSDKGIAAGSGNLLLGSHNGDIGGSFIGAGAGGRRSRIVGLGRGCGSGRAAVRAWTVRGMVIKVVWGAAFNRTWCTAAGAGNVLIAGTIASSLTVWAGFMFPGQTGTRGAAVKADCGSSAFIMTLFSTVQAFFMVDTAFLKAAFSAAGGTDITYRSTAEKCGDGQQENKNQCADG